MKKFLYESHLGKCYWSDNLIDPNDLYCEICGDSDVYLGEASTLDEVKALIDKVSHPYKDYKPSTSKQDGCAYHLLITHNG